MKKSLAILLAIMMLFVLASCGKDKGKDPSGTTGTGAVVTTDHTKTSKTTGKTENTEKQDTEGEIVTPRTEETDSGVQPTTDKPAETAKPAETTKPAGQTQIDQTDTDKTASVRTDTGKTKSGSISSETKKPSVDNDHTTTGGQQDERISPIKPEEQDKESEIIVPSGGIELPIIKP